MVDADAPPFALELNYVAEPVTVLGLPVSRLNPKWQRESRSLEVTSFPGVNAALADLPKLPHLQRIDLHAASLFDYDLPPPGGVPVTRGFDLVRPRHRQVRGRRDAPRDAAKADRPLDQLRERRGA